MDNEQKRRDHLLQNGFPHPIAAPYRMATSAHSAVSRLVYHVATLDGLARYLAVVVLSDLLRDNPKQELRQEMMQALRLPTVGGWARLVKRSMTGAGGREWFMKPLASRFLRKGTKSTRTLDEFVKLAEEADTYFSKTDLMSDEAASKAVEEFVPRLHDVLSSMTFLSDFPLGRIRPQAGSLAEKGFIGTFNRWMGYRPEALPITITLDETPPVEMAVVTTAELDRVLPLDPLAGFDVVDDGTRFYLLAGLHADDVLRQASFIGARIRAVPLGQELMDWYGSDACSPAGELSPSRDTQTRMRTRSRLLPNEKIFDGRFNNLGFIGRGGIGAVYRLVSEEDGTDRAVKILYPDLSRNEFFTRFFLETGSWLAEQSHPGFVQILEAGYSANLQQNHILMEYMPGGSLDDLLTRRELLPPKQAIEILLPILAWMEVLHESGRLHGAVHPSNVLFDADGRARLADFGIFKLPTDQVTTFRPLERIHSISYASPEVLLGGNITKASDIYSVGVLLYRMVTGRLPERNEPKPPSELIYPLPENMDRVLLRALSPRGEDRFNSALRFREALDGLLLEMGDEYEVSGSAEAQQVWGHLGDISAGLRAEILNKVRAAEEAGDWEAAASGLQGLVDEIWDLGERVRVMLRLGRIHLEQLEQPGRAVSIFQECLDWDPENDEAGAALIEHFSKTGDWPELLRLYEETLGGATPERQKTRLEEMARLALEELEDPARAAGYYEKIAALHPEDRQWIDMAVEMKLEARDWTGAAKSLESLVLSLAGSPGEQLPVLKKLATLWSERLHDDRRARGFWEQVFKAEPSDEDCRKNLRRLYRDTFSYAALSDLLESMVDAGDLSPEAEVEVLQEWGEILSSYLYDSKKATEVWNRLLESDPDNYTALSYLERLHLREGNHTAYVEVLERKAKLTEDQRARAEVLLTAAQAQERFFQDVQKARKHLEEALELAPGHPGIETALERLYEEHADADAKIDLLLSRLEREEEKSARIDILRKLAEVFETGKKDPEGALSVLQKLLLEAPEDEAALERALTVAAATEAGPMTLFRFLAEHGPDQAPRIAGIWLRKAFGLGEVAGVELNERIVVLDKAVTCDVTLYQAREDLITLLRDTEQWVRLAEVLLVQLERTRAEDDRRTLIDELGIVCRDRLEDRERAVELLGRALEEQPDHAGAKRILRALLQELGKTDGLIEMLEREAREADDVTIRQQARLDLADILAKGGAPGEAVQHLEAAIEVAPMDPEIHVRLEQALSESQSWEKLIAFYQRMIAAHADPKAKVMYLEKVATLQAELFEDHGAAADSYQQLVQLAPERLEFYDSLQAALEKSERWDDLVWILDRRAVREDPKNQAEAYRNLAAVHQDRRQDVDAAIAALRKGLRADVRDEETLTELRRLCGEHERWDQYLRALKDRTRKLEGQERVPVLLEMANVAWKEMGILPTARKFVDEALQTSGESDEALALARSVYEQQADWGAMAELLGRRFRGAEGAESDAIGLELALINAEHLQREVDAIRILERVLETSPENLDATWALARLYVRQGTWDKAGPLLILLEESAQEWETPKRLELALINAKTQEALLDRGAAIANYKAALEFDPMHLDGRYHLSKLLYLEQAWEEVAALARPLLDADGLRADQRREIGGILADVERRLGKAEQSRESLEKLLAKTPGDVSLLVKLVAVCRDNEDLEAALEYQERLLGVETEPSERFNQLLIKADLADSMGDDRSDDAVLSLQEALELQPDSQSSWLRLSELYLKRKEFAEAIEALASVEKLEKDVAKQSAIAMSQGVILMDYLDDAEGAMPHLERSLDLDPSRLEAFSRVEKIAVGQGDWKLQRDVYSRMLERLGEEGDRSVRLTLHKNLGTIALEKLGDDELARSQLDQALALDPSDADARERLAFLYSGSDEKEKALELYRGLLADDPRNASHLRQLRKIFSGMKAHDEAWCVTAVLALLGAASEKEKQFYSRFSSAALKLKSAALTDRQWNEMLMASEAIDHLNEVMRMLYERLGSRLAVPSPKEAGFGKKERLTEEARTLAAIVKALSKVLGVVEPDVYQRMELTGLRKEATLPPVLVAGKDMIDGKRGKEIRFQTGRSLSLLKPWFGLAGVLDRDTLRTLFLNAMKHVFPELPEPPGDPKVHARLRKEIVSAFPSRFQAELRERIEALRREGAEVNLGRWLSGVEKTANRAGMVFCNDLPLVGTLVQNRYSKLSRLEAEDLVDDLIVYAISDPYFELRRLLGITIM